MWGKRGSKLRTEKKQRKQLRLSKIWRQTKKKRRKRKRGEVRKRKTKVTGPASGGSHEGGRKSESNERIVSGPSRGLGGGEFKKGQKGRRKKRHKTP